MAQSCCRCDDRWPRGENSRRPWPQMSLASAGLLARAKTVHWRCSRLRSDTHRPNHCRAQRLRGEAHWRPAEPAARCGFSSAAQSVRRCRLRVCSRNGAYRLARLAAKFGPEIRLRDLLDRFSYDCLWRAEARGKRGVSACGVYLPDLQQPRPPDMPPGSCACASWSARIDV